MKDLPVMTGAARRWPWSEAAQRDMAWRRRGLSCQRMSWLVLLLTTLLALLLQHGLLANAPLAPDLPLALATWLLVAGRHRCLVRAWIVGVLADLADPASSAFHAVAVALAAAAILPLSDPGRRASGPQVAGWAFVIDLLLGLVDRRWHGAVDPDLGCLLLAALATAIAAWCFCLLPGGLAREWNPVPPLKDPSWSTLRS